MATKESKAFLDTAYKNLGDSFIYKQVPQGELSSAKDAKDNLHPAIIAVPRRPWSIVCVRH